MNLIKKKEKKNRTTTAQSKKIKVRGLTKMAE